KAKVDAYRNLARQKYGRDIQVWSYAYVVQGETEQEAHAYFDEYVNQKGDWEAVTNLVETMIANAKTLPAPVLAEMKRHFIAGWGGYPLIGPREQIVDGLVRLKEIGLDGTLLNWPRYIDDMRWFRDNVYPLVVQAGLRERAWPRRAAAPNAAAQTRGPRCSLWLLHGARPPRGPRPGGAPPGG